MPYDHDTDLSDLFPLPRTQPRQPWQDLAGSVVPASDPGEDEDTGQDADSAAALPLAPTPKPAPTSAPAPAPAPMNGREAAAFLAGWVKDWPAEWFLNLTAIPAAAGGAAVGVSWPAHEVAARQGETAAWIARHSAERCGIYFTPNPLRRAVGKKPAKADIAAPWALSVDLDPPPTVGDSADWSARRARVLAAAEALSQDSEAPALIVDSGNGIGAFYRVPPETTAERAEAACKGKTHALAERFGLKADGTHNIDRLMRVPGTLNWPSPSKLKGGYPDEPSRARVLSDEPTAVLSSERVAALAALAPAVTGAKGTKAAAQGQAQAKGGDDEGNEAGIEAAIATLLAVWPSITALGTKADLDADLRERLDNAILDKQGLSERWFGKTDRLEDTSGSGVLMALVASAKAARFSLEDTARIAWVSVAGDHLRRQPTPYFQARAVARPWVRTVADPDAVPAGVQALTDEGWFVVRIGGRVGVGRREADGDLTLLRQADFITLMAHRTVPTPKGAKPVAPLWLAHKARPTFAGAGCYPPGAACPPDHLNLWPGWGVEPSGGRAGCRRILRHLLDVICQGNRDHWKWLLRWMAWGVQNPAEKQDVAVVLVGGQGTGKGAIATVLRRIYGGGAVTVADKRRLVGNFNAHLAGKSFVFADEALFAGDPGIVGPLKSLVTERVMAVERKGWDTVEAPNRLRILMASNEAHAVHLDSDDRRFAVFQTAAKMPQHHYDRLFAEINGDGAAAFFATLLRMNLDGYDMRALPATKARVEQKLESLPALAAWWGNVLSDGADDGAGFGGPADWFGKQATRAPKADIYGRYADAMRQKGERRVLDPRQFWAGLRKMVVFQEIRPAGNKGRVIVLPTLADARDQFAQHHGLGALMEWPD